MSRRPRTGKVAWDAQSVASYNTRRGGYGKSRRASSRVSAYTPSDGGTYYDGDTYYDGESRYDGDGGETYYDGDTYYDGESYYGDEYEEGAYVPPDFEIADEHAREQNPQHFAIGKPFALKPMDLKQYGVGVVLYFNYMRTLSFCFLVLGLLALPSVYLNLTGSFYEPKDDALQQMIEQASLGNLFPLYEWEMGGPALAADGHGVTTAPAFGSALYGGTTAPPSPEQWVNQSEGFVGEWTHGEALKVTYFGFKTGKDELLVGLSYLNLVLLAMFTGFAFVIGPAQEKIVKEVDKNLTTIEDYSVVVRDMPRDMVDPTELWKFFDKRIGKVQDVQLAYNTSELLGLALEREKLKTAYESAAGHYRKARELSLIHI